MYTSSEPMIGLIEFRIAVEMNESAVANLIRNGSDAFRTQKLHLFVDFEDGQNSKYLPAKWLIGQYTTNPTFLEFLRCYDPTKWDSSYLILCSRNDWMMQFENLSMNSLIIDYDSMRSQRLCIFAWLQICHLYKSYGNLHERDYVLGNRGYSEYDMWSGYKLWQHCFYDAAGVSEISLLYCTSIKSRQRLYSGSLLRTLHLSV